MTHIGGHRDPHDPQLFESNEQDRNLSLLKPRNLNSGGLHKSISEFRSMWKDGISSPTRYAVELSSLPYYDEMVYPETITLPSRSFSLYTDGIYGAIRQFPYRRLYNDQIVMTFLVGEDQRIRSAFEKWMDQQITPEEKINPENTNARHANMFIYTLDHQGKQTSQFEVTGAYPFSIIPSNYGYGMLNETAKLQVTFNYRNYRHYITQ